MIDIYTERKKDDNWIIINDLYFNQFTSKEEFTDDEIELIKEIDKVEFIGGKHIKSRFGTGTLENLSTGCKVVLNILKHPEKVVCVDECSGKILSRIFKLTDIKICSTYPSYIEMADDVEMRFNGKDVVRGYSGYGEWWDKEYKRQNNE